MDINNVYASNSQTYAAAYRPHPLQNAPDHETSGSEQVKAASVNAGKSMEPSGGRPTGDHQEEEITTLDRKVTSDFLEKTIDEANKKLNSSDLRFSYSVHEKTGEFIVKIINTATDEVVREVPPEKHLDAIAKMWELAGIFVDQKK